MQVLAHRGVSPGQPENTLSAFQRAIELGADGVELDVRLSADGVPVVIHDDRLERTTNGQGRVGDLTAAELQRLDAGDGQGIPTLQEVIEVIGPEALLNAELKGKGSGSATLDVLTTLDPDRWAISSFDWDVLRALRARSSEAVVWPVSFVADEAVIRTAQELGADVISLHQAAIDSEVAARLEQHGLGMMAWTVNAPARAEELGRLGVVAICTDDPPRVRTVGSRDVPARLRQFAR